MSTSRAKGAKWTLKQARIQRAVHWLLVACLFLGNLPHAAASSMLFGAAFEVLVEDEAGDPIRGVQVVAVRATETEYWRWMSQGLPAEDWPVGKGMDGIFAMDRTKTKSNGLARFSEGSWGSWVVVSKKQRGRHAPRLLACGRLPQKFNTGNPLVLILREPSPLQVHVTDAEGRAMAGVKIEVGKANLIGGLDPVGRHAFVTDELGLVVVPEASAILSPLLGAKGAIHLNLVSPTKDVAFDLDALGEEAIEFVAPKGRDVDVRLLSSDGGDPIRSDARLSLQPVVWVERGQGAYVSFEDGVAHLRNVPLGVEFVARGALKDGDLAGETRLKIEDCAAAPLQLDVCLPKPTWILSGRIVDAKGHALKSQSLQVGFGVLTSEVLTDARGNFDVLFGDSWGSPGSEMGCVWFGLAGRMGKSRLIGADVEDGEVDLGKIRLDEPDLLCAGVVRSPDGAPVQGAWIQLYGERKKGAIRIGVPIVGVVSDARGRFEIRSLQPETAVYLTLGHGTLVPKTWKHLFEPGDLDHQLELFPAGAIAGKLTHAPTESVFVRLVPMGAGWNTTVQSWAGRPGGDYGASYARDFTDLQSAFELNSKGAFSLERVAAGAYDLGIFRAFTSEPLAVIEGLVVPEFGECADPRLEQICLEP